MITKLGWRAAAGSWCFPIQQNPYQYVALEERKRNPTVHTLGQLLRHLDITFGRL